MTPHDLELKRYNEITHRLNQIETMLFTVMDHPSHTKTHKLLQDSVHLSLVYLKDVKDKFRHFTPRQDDPT